MSNNRPDSSGGQAGPANVVPLEWGLRLTRANTKASGLYEQKAAELCELMRKRLSLLEEALFLKSPGLRSCSKGHVSKPEYRFECRHGTIDLSFSRDQQRFVLLDFQFHEGGGGGLPAPQPVQPFARAIACALAASSFPARLVARLMLWSAPSLKKTTTALIEVKPSQLYLFETAKARLRLKEQEASKYAQVNRDAMTVGIHAEGSILSDFVLTPLQLENRYARSILAGEAICDTALRSSFGRTILVQAKYRTHKSAELFHESASALGVLFAGHASPSPKPSRLVVNEALGSSALADDRLLPIIRGELAAHLSIYVACTAASRTQRSSSRSKSSYADAVILMKKYSLLADLVTLSMRLPPHNEATTDIEVVVSDYSATLRNKISACAVAAFGAFDACIHTTVSGIGAGAAVEEAERSDMAALHRRALDLTKALLEPPSE